GRAAHADLELVLRPRAREELLEPGPRLPPHRADPERLRAARGAAPLARGGPGGALAPARAARARAVGRPRGRGPRAARARARAARAAHRGARARRRRR